MKQLLLLIVFSFAAFAQVLPIPPDADSAIAGTVNFEGTITQGVTNLITNVAPSIMPFGWSVLGIFGVYALLQTLLTATLRSMSMHHYNPLATIAAYVSVLFRIAVATAMMTFYLVPIPGLPFNFHQIFPYLAQALSNSITMDAMKTVIGYFNDSMHFMPAVGMFQVIPALITIVLLFFIALAQVGMTVITAGSYVIVGILTLCGPLMIPFYVLPGHEKRFWSWFDNMLAYSMYVFVGSAFIFVFCQAYVDFFSNIHQYTVMQWMVSLPYFMLITIVFLWTMFKVPEVTHLIFGGYGGVAADAGAALQGLVVRGVMKLL
jgi:hypothetical protein